MEFKHMQTFVTAVAQGGLVKAAESLGYSQSTVTLQIQQLEAELKIELFKRQGKRMQLSEAGRLFYEKASHIVKEVMSLQETMQELTEGMSGHIRLGTTETAAAFKLPRLLQAFCTERPKIKVSLEVSSTSLICERLMAEELDLGFCTTPPGYANLNFEPCYQEKIVLLVPEKYALSRNEVIRVTDLNNYRVLQTGPGCAYRAAAELALLEHNANPFSGIVVGSVESLKQMVQNGFGLGLVPQTAVEEVPPGTVARTIENLEMSVTYGLVSRKEEPGGGGKLQNDFRTYLQNSLATRKTKSVS